MGKSVLHVRVARDGSMVPYAEREQVARAVRHVVSHISDFPGADCIRYALVGLTVLRYFGIAARLQVGGATWRLGPGSGDILTHDSSLSIQSYGPGGPTAGPYHAWIRIDGRDGGPAYLVDFTTGQLAAKARALDAADGGNTVVEFRPDYLWLDEHAPTLTTPAQVVAGYAAGLCSYVSKPVLMPAVVNQRVAQAARIMAPPAIVCVRALQRGAPLPEVIGIDAHGVAPPPKPLVLRRSELRDQYPAARTVKP